MCCQPYSIPYKSLFPPFARSDQILQPLESTVQDPRPRPHGVEDLSAVEQSQVAFTEYYATCFKEVNIPHVIGPIQPPEMEILVRLKCLVMALK